MKPICILVTLLFGAIVFGLVAAVSLQQGEIARLQAQTHKQVGTLSDKVGRVGKAVDSIPPDPLPIYINPIKGEIRGVLANRHR